MLSGIEEHLLLFHLTKHPHQKLTTIANSCTRGQILLAPMDTRHVRSMHFYLQTKKEQSLEAYLILATVSKNIVLYVEY